MSHVDKPYIGDGVKLSADDAQGWSEVTSKKRKGSNRVVKGSVPKPTSVVGGTAVFTINGEELVGPALTDVKERPQAPPFVPSFYTGVVQSAGKFPDFIGSRVPSRSANGTGYWYPFNKQDTTGVQITVWYFYNPGDGPWKEKMFGDELPKGGQWVHRKNVLDPTASEHRVSYTPGIPRIRGILNGLRWRNDENLPPKQTAVRVKGATSRPVSAAQSQQGSRAGSRGGSGAATPSFSWASVASQFPPLSTGGSRVTSTTASRAASRDPSPDRDTLINLVTMVSAAVATGTVPPRDQLEHFAKPVPVPVHVETPEVDIRKRVNIESDVRRLRATGAVVHEPPQNAADFVKLQTTVPEYKRILGKGSSPAEVFPSLKTGCACDSRVVWNTQKSWFPSDNFIRCAGQAHAKSAGTGLEVEIRVKFNINESKPVVDFLEWYAHVQGDTTQLSAEHHSAVDTARLLCKSTVVPTTDWAADDVTVEATENLVTVTTTTVTVKDEEPKAQRSILKSESKPSNSTGHGVTFDGVGSSPLGSSREWSNTGTSDSSNVRLSSVQSQKL